MLQLRWDLENNMNSEFSVIIVAAGSGSRMHSKEKKQFIHIGGKPVFVYSALAYKKCGIEKITVVTGKDDIEKTKSILKEYNLENIKVVAGGKRRPDSVMAGLSETDSKYVMIHDGVRPFITTETIEKCMEAVVDYEAVIAAVPVKDTIKICENNTIKETLPRQMLYAAQTPQCFTTELIKEAYKKAVEDGALDTITDDAAIVEKYSGHSVKIVEGNYLNIKITEPGDLIMAESWLSKE